jgi:phage protein D
MTPAFRVTVDGQDATGALRDRLLSLTVAEN